MQLSRPLGWTNCCATIAALFWWYRTPRRDPPTSHHWSPSFSHFQVEHRILILHSRFRPSSLPPFFYHLVMVVLINEHGLHFFSQITLFACYRPFFVALHYSLPPPRPLSLRTYASLSPPSPLYTLDASCLYLPSNKISRTTTVAYY